MKYTFAIASTKDDVARGFIGRASDAEKRKGIKSRQDAIAIESDGENSYEKALDVLVYTMEQANEKEGRNSFKFYTVGSVVSAIYRFKRAYHNNGGRMLEKESFMEKFVDGKTGAEMSEFEADLWSRFYDVYNNRIEFGEVYWRNGTKGDKMTSEKKIAIENEKLKLEPSRKSFIMAAINDAKMAQATWDLVPEAAYSEEEEFEAMDEDDAIGF